MWLRTKITLALAILSLAACAPQNTAPSKPLIEGPVGFYPSQPGLDWIYLPQQSSSTDPPYRLSILGSTSFNGQVATRYRFSGRGQERYYYRQIGVGGVRLLGLEEVITNSTVRFNPPMQEYPAAASLLVGARWGGTTRMQSELIVDGKKFPQAETSFEYSYSVLGKSVVNLPAGSFEVYRIRLEIKNPQSKEEYEIWFVPGVGEVKTREGLQLVERNFK